MAMLSIQWRGRFSIKPLFMPIHFRCNRLKLILYMCQSTVFKYKRSGFFSTFLSCQFMRYSDDFSGCCSIQFACRLLCWLWFRILIQKNADLSHFDRKIPLPLSSGVVSFCVGLRDIIRYFYQQQPHEAK